MNLSKYVDNVSFHEILFIIIILISWMEGQFSSSRDHQVEYVSFFCFFQQIVFIHWEHCIYCISQVAMDIDNKRSHQGCFIKKGVLRNFTKFTGNHLRPATLLKKNFGKFLRTPLDNCFCNKLSQSIKQIKQRISQIVFST